MDVNVITQLIGNLGFPIFTAIYFMTQTKKVLETNTSAILEVKSLIERLDSKQEVKS